MPQQSFSVSNFYDYVVTGSVRRTMKNTITRKPCSLPRPFVSLWIGCVTHRAIEDPLYSPALPKRVLPADGTQAWESLTVTHVMFCSWHPNASWWIEWQQLPAPAPTAAEQQRRRRAVKNLPTVYKNTGKGRWLWMSLPWQDSHFSFLGHWHSIGLKQKGMSMFWLRVLVPGLPSASQAGGADTTPLCDSWWERRTWLLDCTPNHVQTWDSNDKCQ